MLIFIIKYLIIKSRKMSSVKSKKIEDVTIFQSDIRKSVNKLFYITPDKSMIILWHPESRDFIKDEYDMIEHLRTFGFPMVPVLKFSHIKIQRRQDKYCFSLPALYLKYIDNAQLIKFSQMNCKFKVSSKVRQKFIDMYIIIKKNNILIEDLQILLTENDFFIIDPLNIYNLKENSSFLSKGRVNEQLVKKMFLQQLQFLEELIKFNKGIVPTVE